MDQATEEWVRAEMTFPRPTPDGQIGLFEAVVRFPSDTIEAEAIKAIHGPRAAEIDAQVRHTPFERACEILRSKGMADTEIAALFADLTHAGCPLFNSDGTLDLLRVASWATRQKRS